MTDLALDNPLPNPSPMALRAAKFATLTMTARSPQAMAMVEVMAAEFEASEKTRKLRDRARRHGPLLAFKTALAAVLGDLLVASPGLPDDGLIYRSLDANSFTGAPVSYDSFKSAMDGLENVGLVQVFSGYRSHETTDWGDGVISKLQTGKAARYRATAALVTLAERHGVEVEDLATHFTRPRPTKTPKRVLSLKSRSGWGRWGKVAGQDLDCDETPQTLRLANEVRRINAFIATVEIEGAGHDSFCRAFAMGDVEPYGWNKGGRLIGYGDDAYQAAKPSRRLAVTLNGEQVVEIDIKASHLTILHALAGQPLDMEEDAYDGLGIDREIAKLWLTATLGKGSPVTKWPKRIADNYRAKTGKALGSVHRASEVCSVMLARYPLLAGMAGLGITWADLQFTESEVLVGAMLELIDAGVPSLPVHDSLIVPTGREEFAKDVLACHFERVVGVRPGLKVSR